METHDRRRLERHARRLEDLGLWRNAREHPVEEWSFAAGGGKPKRVRLGDFWPEVALPVELSARVAVPEEWAGEPVELELWLGGEGFVRVSTGEWQSQGGLNPFHRTFPVSEKAKGAETVEIEAEVVSKGLWGSHVAEPRIERAALVVPEVGLRALERDFRVVVAACEELDGHDAVPLLLDALDAAGAALSAGWPSETGRVAARYLRGYGGPVGDGLSSLPAVISGQVSGLARGMRDVWSVPSATRPLEPLPDEARGAVEEARKILAAGIEEAKREYPPVGRLALTGHAHIDLAWLWPVSETRRKARRTFASVLGLMDRYEDFVFNQSSAQLYAWIESDAPELFGRIRERVAEGRWEPVGGSWCEPDCQIPSGESFVRQLLHGQRYFEEKFGRRSTVAWLPDAFGFSAGIPQLLRGAGISGFYTAKLKWSETNRFPHDLFVWEGVDGSRVTAHFTRNPGMDYNGDVAPFDLLGVWRNFAGKRHHPESLFPFGWGDGGGGPSEEMLEGHARLKDFPALPSLRMAGVEAFFENLPESGLPRWTGELYLELHRGTLTTQGMVKKLNREAEHRLPEAEAFAAVASLLGAEYPAEKFDGLWKTLLLNQFHDILPGTSVAEVYEDSHEQLREVVGRATALRDHALRGPTGGAMDAVLVANAGLAPRPLSVVLPKGLPDGASAVADAEGAPIPCQRVHDGLLVHAPGRRVAGLGWTALRPTRRNGALETNLRVVAGTFGSGTYIENDLLRVEIGADGTLRRVYDREAGREVLDGRGNQLRAYADRPREWDAWDIEEDYERDGEEILAVQSVEVVEEGPLRAAVRVRRCWRNSSIEQTYSLLSGSRRLDVETEIEWREREVLLRALFPLNVRSAFATFETMYGAVERPTHRNTSWDAARFEVAAHRWADLSEPGYGVALLNDGKYGHSARDNVLGLSLLRGPLYPDPFADEGEHRFTYSLLPHPGTPAEAGVAEEAFALNSPLAAVMADAAADAVADTPEEAQELRGFVSVEGMKLALGALKRAEDGRGLVLRLHEPYGARGTAVLRFARTPASVERADLLEEPEGPVELRDGAVRMEVRPFEVVTLRLGFGAG